MAIRLRYTAFSDVGRVRKNNQDSAYASPRLLVLADGMGGGPAGDVASSVTLHTVRRLETGDSPADLLEALAGAVDRANDKLTEVLDSDPSVEGMGTTLTAFMADGEQVGLAHVGDSRAYLLRRGELSQLTRDHTFVQKLVDEGRISAAEARNHPHRSLILQALDGRHEIEPDLQLLTLEPGDRLLLCSDGVTDVLDDADIAELLGAETVDAAAVGLVQAALDAGSTDNVTCVIAEAAEGDGADFPTEPMLVGAAAEQARPGGGRGGTAPTIDVVEDAEDTGGAVPQDDPEALRYAPQPPRRLGGLRRLLAVLAVLGVLAAAVAAAYSWSQQQFYVGSANGRVAIYRGLEQDLPGVELSKVEQEFDLTLEELPTFERDRVEAGIEASSFEDAEDTVAALQQRAAECAGGDPSCEGVTQSQTDPTTTPTPTRDPADKQTQRPRQGDGQGGRG